MLIKAQIQLVKSLRSKKFRQKYNQFIAEGEKAVDELLKSDINIVHVFGTEEWESQHGAQIAGIEYTRVKNGELERLSGFEQPNKVLAIAEIPDYKFTEKALEQKLCLALDFIQDPGNLGTIIRIADWYGINDILCSENCADAFNPKVINATMGSFARVRVHYINLDETLAPFAGRLYAAVLDGKPVYDIKEAAKPIILIGNEGKGISDNLLKLAKNKVSIPRNGNAESLNAAVAAAVLTDNFTRINR